MERSAFEDKVRQPRQAAAATRSVRPPRSKPVNNDASAAVQETHGTLAEEVTAGDRGKQLCRGFIVAIVLFTWPQMHTDNDHKSAAQSKDGGPASLALPPWIRTADSRYPVGIDSFSSLIQHFIQIQHQIRDHRPRRQFTRIERSVRFRFADGDQLLAALHVFLKGRQVVCKSNSSCSSRASGFGPALA